MYMEIVYEMFLPVFSKPRWQSLYIILIGDHHPCISVINAYMLMCLTSFALVKNMVKVG